MRRIKSLLFALCAMATLSFGSGYCQGSTGDPLFYAAQFEESFPIENNSINYSAKQSYKRTFYVDALNGNDSNRGISMSAPLRTLLALESVGIKPGDQILLKGGQTHMGTIELIGLNDSGSNAPIHIGSYGDSKAQIDFEGYPSAITVQNSSNVVITDLKITANGGPAATQYMYRKEDQGVKRYRYAIFINSIDSIVRNIEVNNVDIRDVYFYNEDDENTPTHIRPCRVWSTNGESEYGWGIRALSRSRAGGIDGLTIKSCRVEDVSHTGIKINGSKGVSPINNLFIEDCTILNTGGPGSQFGGVNNGVMRHCKTVNSGSRNEPRKWGRGSGMWTHTCDNFIFEHSLFEGAQGIADCCGGHIDIGCTNVVMQYNLSRNNAGGFVEILGRCDNCSYRYNISIDDGWRNPTDMQQDDFWMWQQKAIDERGNDMRKIIGKYGCLITLNGHTGGQFEGPYHSYIYNNTIVCSEERADGFTNGFVFEVASSVEGINISNNLFWIPSQMMYSGSARFLNDGKLIDNAYDLRKATGEFDGSGVAVVRDMTESEVAELDVVIDNNLYRLYDPQYKRGENVLPYDASGECKNRYYDENALGGDPGFRKSSNWKYAEDLIPSNADVINRGTTVEKLASDKSSYGIIPQITMSYDFFGNPITEPIIGACVVK